jgi:NAD(P)-dependent dehydrogenase (short-subunit alcohol dehydrogenase family)
LSEQQGLQPEPAAADDATSWTLGLSERAYIVTGAASGIGKEAALRLSGLVASVVAVDRDRAGLEAVAAGAERVVAVSGDCTQEEVVDQSLAEANDRFGRLDGLVSNVGAAVTGRIESLSTESWSSSLSINLSSHFLMTRSLMRHLTAQGTGGSLVYIASKNAYSPAAGFAAYSVAKAGLVQLARLAAIEGAPSGIRANIVCPDNVFEGSHLWSDEIKAMAPRSTTWTPTSSRSSTPSATCCKPASCPSTSCAPSSSSCLTGRARRQDACSPWTAGSRPCSPGSLGRASVEN